MKHSHRFLQLVDDAKSRIPEVTVHDVRARLARKDAFVLVDVREESEWAAAHARGAVYLGRGILERDVEARWPDPTTDLVLYCGGGFRSALAADSLRQMGYTQVSSLAGGFRAWKEGGGEID